jgi:hypothetical protein
MKKATILLLLITAFAITSCTDSEKAETTAKPSNSALRETNQLSETGRGCPEGYRPVYLFSQVTQEPFMSYAQSCQGGFGLCMGTITHYFMCIESLKFSLELQQRLSYDPKTDVGDMLIEVVSPTLVRLWIPKAMEQSRSHKPSDFDFFSIDNVDMNNGAVTLLKGDYPKVVNGNFITYDINAIVR